MTVADQIAGWLYEKGITHAFGIVGGGNVALWDAITRAKKTQLVCVHHEQTAAMSSAYFNRCRHGMGSVALVTTGAGSTNALTGVMAAFMDRAPLLVISGNEASRYMYADTRVWGVQGYDSELIGGLMAKDSHRAKKGAVMSCLDWLAAEAVCAPQGPVWLDIPKDVQTAEAE